MAYDLMGVFEQAQALLEDDPLISMAKLSRELNVDRHTIGKAVQLAAGMPFRTWKRGVLFHQACQLLAGTPDRRIQAISSGLGYSSLASFRRFVGRNCHLSPTALRGILRSGRPVTAGVLSRRSAASMSPRASMTHDLLALLDRMHLALEANPHASFKQVLRQPEMDRHTLEHAVRATAGTSSSRLQGALALTQTRALIASSANRSIKEIAGLLGYPSQRSFARFRARRVENLPGDLRKKNDLDDSKNSWFSAEL